MSTRTTKKPLPEELRQAAKLFGSLGGSSGVGGAKCRGSSDHYRLPKGFSPRTLKRLKKAGKISRGISNPGGVWVADLEVLKRELMRW